LSGLECSKAWLVFRNEISDFFFSDLGFCRFIYLCTKNRDYLMISVKIVDNGPAVAALVSI